MPDPLPDWQRGYIRHCPTPHEVVALLRQYEARQVVTEFQTMHEEDKPLLYGALRERIETRRTLIYDRNET